MLSTIPCSGFLYLQFLAWCRPLLCVHSSDSEGVHMTVDVGECVNICEGWVSGFAGMKVRISVL